MEIVDIIVEALKYILPAVLVLVGVKLVFDQQLRKEAANESLQLKAEVLKEHLPLRLSAYERAVLFLERISPQKLIPESEPQGKSARELHAQLQAQVRHEYEHNLVQQLYISNRGWAALFQAKEQVLAILNAAMASIPPNADGISLASKVLQAYSELPELPTQKAIFMLKSDISSLFSMTKRVE